MNTIKLLIVDDHQPVRDGRTIESAIRGETLLQSDIMSKVLAAKERKEGSGVTERTVKAHLTSIYSKLGVDSRSQAVATAMERGIIHI
ncbi:response regulator transcription factor [Paenibacillus albidus]|nr:response regulator transcription factor [Paenibacillus albidus]